LLTGLWRHPDFRKLWAGQTVALFGQQFGFLAFPLTAVLVLNASAAQMGGLLAVQFAPGLIFGLAAGVIVDRLPRRRVMLAANWFVAAALLSVPVTAGLHLLTLGQLYVAAFLVGTAVTFFMVAYRAYLPALVGPGDLVEANGKLETSRASAQLLAPGLAGALVQVISAPFVLAVEGFGYLFANATILAIRSREPAVQPSGRNVWSEAREGLAALFQHPLIRPIVLAIATFNAGAFSAAAVYILYASRSLHVSPAELGLVLATGSIGGLAGAQLARPLAARFGLGPVIATAPLFFAAGFLLTPLAGGPHWLVLGVLGAGQLLINLSAMIFNVNQVSLRQAVIPGYLQGRLQAGVLQVIWSGQLVGSLLGGALGQTIGLRPTLYIAAALPVIGLLWLIPSEVPRLREQPDQVADARRPDGVADVKAL
jgi:MFS family permease